MRLIEPAAGLAAFLAVFACAPNAFSQARVDHVTEGTTPSTQSIPSTDPALFPYVISVALSPTHDFRPGDKINITSVRGDRPRIEVGGHYLVEGTYTLASAPTGTLSISVTSSAVPRTPVGNAAEWNRRYPSTPSYHIEQGQGTFAFVKTMYAPDGRCHVSFYLPTGPHRSASAGGVYFDDR